MTKRLRNSKQIRQKGSSGKRSSKKQKSRAFQNERYLNSPASSSSSPASSSRTATTTASSSSDSILYESSHHEETQTSSSDISENLSDGELQVVPAVKQIKSFAEDFKYFEKFSDLPDINDLSEDISLTYSKPLKEIASHINDMGYFVHPLTGLELSTHSDLTSSPKIDSIECLLEEEQLELSDFLLSEYELEEDSATLEPRKTLMDEEKEETEFLLKTFFNPNSFELNEATDEIEVADLKKERHTEEILQQTLEFINDLVQKVVENVELATPETILRKSLDKRKLLLELLNLRRKSKQEQNISNFVNKRVVEFHRRRNIYIPIIKATTGTNPQENEKYLRAMKRLDELLARQRNMEDSLSKTMATLNSELKTVKQEIQDQILAFENLVKKNLYRRDLPQSKGLIEKLLKSMANCRQEISNVRLQLITKQQDYAHLLNKDSHLENVGPGVSLKYCDHVQTENNTLGHEIEKRKSDLKKLHLRLCRNIHILAHVKEQQISMKSLVAKQSSRVRELRSEHGSLRKYVNQSRLKNGNVCKEIEKLSFQSGLLGKPILMYDYDQTVEHINEQREMVDSLRNTLETIQQKINKLEKRLTS